MNRIDRIISIVLLLLAIGYAYAGWHLDLYTPQGPGPGLLPKLLAVVLALFSVIIWLKGATDTLPPSGVTTEWRRPMIALGVLFAYVPALWLVGYAVSTFAMVLAIRRVFQPGRWRTDIVGAAVIALGAQVIFGEILKMQINVIPQWVGF
jgi:hypothetical protein